MGAFHSQSLFCFRAMGAICSWSLFCKEQWEQFAFGHKKWKRSEKLSKHGEKYEFFWANCLFFERGTIKSERDWHTVALFSTATRANRSRSLFKKSNFEWKSLSNSHLSPTILSLALILWNPKKSWTVCTVQDHPYTQQRPGKWRHLPFPLSSYLSLQ